MTRELRFSTVAAASICSALVCAQAPGQGTIVGRVKFDGEMKNPKPIRVQGDAFCVDAHKTDKLFDESFVFNKEKGTLTNVIVYVNSPVNASSEAALPEVVIDQRGCHYSPHVVAVTTGQKLKITNSDATAHNLNLKAENNKGFNVSQPVQGMVYEAQFDKPELAMPLKCDVHAWMGAWVAVFDHPFHAVSDENGEFRIEGLPAGEYDLAVWHEFKYFAPVEATKKVTVADGQETEVEFTYAVKQ